MLKAALRDAIPIRLQVPLKYWYGAARRFHEPEMALLPYLVEKGSHALDVGGNRGTYAYALHRLGARLEVFEPHPSCAKVLCDWSRSKGGVHVHRVALSDAAGQALLHVPVDEHGVAHDASASVESAVTSARTRDILVRLQTLDSFNFRDVEFIKIDTEGHEGSVLAGAAETIKASHPSLLVEIEQRHLQDQPISAAFAQIAAMGYAGFFLSAGRLLPIAEFDFARHQSAEAFANGGVYINNFLFLPETDAGRDRHARLTARLAN